MGTTESAATSFGALHFWESDLPCWVRGATKEDAQKTLEAEHGGYLILKMVPDEEPFQMIYEDEPPKGLEYDEKCECSPEDLVRYGCDCEAQFRAVTKPAGYWANRKDQEWIIYRQCDV